MSDVNYGSFSHQFSSEADKSNIQHKIASENPASTTSEYQTKKSGSDSLTGPEDVVDVLMSEHADVYSSLVKLTEESDPAKRRKLSAEIISKLVCHSVSEEMYVYPVIKQALQDGGREVDDDTAQHQRMEEVMAELEKTDTSEPAFLELTKKLLDIFIVHKDSEETHQFPSLRKAVPDTQLIELAHKVTRVQKIAPTHPHPHTNMHTPGFHTIMGPAVGLADRLRDSLSRMGSS
jgi:hypothetical protein